MASVGTREKARILFDTMPYPSSKDRDWRHIVLGSYDAAENRLVAPTYQAGNPTQSVELQIDTGTDSYPKDGRTNHKFHLLNHLYWQHGALLSIPPDTIVKQPIEIAISSEAAGTVLPHLHIQIGKGSQATIVERYRFPMKKNTIVSSHTLMQCEEGSSATLISDVTSSNHYQQFHHLEIVAKRDSSIISYPIVYGNGLTRIDVQANLIDPGANVVLLGTGVARGSAQLIFNTIQEHTSPNGTSDLDYRMILANQAQTFYRGLIKISPGAHGSNAYQKNLNTMLSSFARAHSVPELEIEADQVRCTHGATSGPIDQNQMFYAASRGISGIPAIRMLSEAFFSPLYSKIENTSARNYVSRLVKKAIAQVQI